MQPKSIERVVFANGVSVEYTRVLTLACDAAGCHAHAAYEGLDRWLAARAAGWQPGPHTLCPGCAR